MTPDIHEMRNRIITFIREGDVAEDILRLAGNVREADAQLAKAKPGSRSENMWTRERVIWLGFLENAVHVALLDTVYAEGWIGVVADGGTVAPGRPLYPWWKFGLDSTGTPEYRYHVDCDIDCVARICWDANDRKWYDPKRADYSFWRSLDKAELMEKVEEDLPGKGEE